MTLIDISPELPAPVPTDPNVLQRRASGPDSSVWVGASAGTGKTKVLTDRVLRLMLAGTDPGRILCLTFTKAAAAEMSNRIADRLAKWAVQPDAELRDNLHALTGVVATTEQVTAARRLFARVLDAPGGMKIQTIHSFCQSLLRRFPLEAGLTPNFEVMDDRTAAELLDEVRADMLAKARFEPDCDLGQAVARLAAALSEDEFGKLLQDITTERGRVRRILDAHGGLDATVEAVFRFLKVGRDETEETVVKEACREGAFDDRLLRDACRVLSTSGKTDGERGIAIQAWLDRAENRTATFRDYAGAFLTKEGEPRKALMGKKIADANPHLLDCLAAEAVRLQKVLERVRCVTVARSTGALLTLAEALLTGYEAAKRSRAQLDFDDLILRAARLLTEDARSGACAWVLFKLDGGLDHILVDEAQDTNPEQWDVVKAIAEEFFSGQGAAAERMRTLFVVGDDKQSIFSFQRADPAEFLRMRGHFEGRVQAAEKDWQGIDLQISFRSVGAVLKAVDEVFRLDAARDGVIEPGKEVRHIPFRRQMAGQVELWPVVQPQDKPEPENWAPPLSREQQDQPMARLATVIADQIAQWLRDGEKLPARGRALRPGDIMVLVRRRNAFVQHLVRALKDRDVPVAGVDRMVLTQQLAVQDLMALGQFLLLPEDDLTLATVLKSPLIGLTEEELFQVAWNRKGHLWPALIHKARAEGPDSRFAEAQRYLAGLMSETDYRAPFELFAGVLSRPCPADPETEQGGGSGRRAILARLGAEAVDPLDEFLAAALLFEREHVPSLQIFLNWMAASEAEVKRELDTGGGHGSGRVRIMTVHGSKGLQAPLVILPDTMGEPDQSPRILWPDGIGGRNVPLYAPRRTMEDGACQAARAAADARRDQEYRRLLYVALTRAEDRLILCGWDGQRKSGGPGCWYRLAETALQEIADSRDYQFTLVSPAGWDGPGLVLSEPQVVPPKPDHLDLDEEKEAEPVPDWARAGAPSEPTPTRPLTPSRPDKAEPSVRSPLGPDDGLGFKRGNLIHKLLQILPDMPAARWREAAEGWLARPAHGLTPEQQAEIASETLAVLTDPRFADLFAPGSRAEVPIVGMVGGRVLSGQIDRLVVTDAAVLIVDYKTNRPPPVREEDVPEIYLEQMAAYRAAVQRIYADKPIRCLLLWTDGPYTMELTPARLDAHAPG
ncbi:double-strand break repair helicase AddA [Indioceanicola profundi]|uniref:double-strand break repair helicase AddA n=1 Tax=Indioceanicola profundi TaxID=2220096 RepID=UPI000E6AAC9C|nr:double-strand break repair helicase AddA [Indioceanicola profundi]